VDPLVDATGQPYTYTGDDPVNEADPNGLAPYNYTFDLGLNSIPPPQLASFLRQNCSTAFGVSGCPDNFQLGQELPLAVHVAGFTESFPVRVTRIEPSSFTLTALPGHPEGAGRTITFTFEQATDGEDLLNVRTSSNGSLLTKPPLEIPDFLVAHSTWASMAAGFEWAYAQAQYLKAQAGVGLV
jgi:hypothetical protein